MGKNDGRFKKGERRSPETEFKTGTHWRERKPYYDRDWMFNAYIAEGWSTGEIASEFGVTDAAIIFWLRKHGIPRRTVSEARAIKHWGVSGEENPMHGKRGADNYNWKGGCTPERQSFYASLEWVDCVKAIWKRDRGTCQRCGSKSNRHGKFHIHHIASFAVKELRAETSNLMLLCADCHHWVHSRANVNREFTNQERRPGE